MAFTSDEFAPNLEKRLVALGYTAPVETRAITEAVAKTMAEDAGVIAAVERKRMDLTGAPA